MRAMICKALEGAGDLIEEEVAAPLLPPGAVRIGVRAAGINFADSLIITGKYHDHPQPPFIPGMEVAGVVLETADGVTTCRPGDRVMAAVDGGGFAEQAIALADDVQVLPAAMDFVTAAAFPVAYGTSYHALVDKAGLKAGETLLVTGAAGGVGLTAVEIGHALGATVIATAGGADKLAVALSRGADHGIDYKSEDIRERVKALTGGRGVDVVYDPVGGPVFDASLRATKPNGRLLVIGFAGGKVQQIAANYLLIKNLTVIGYVWGIQRKMAMPAIRRSFTHMLEWFAEGKLKPLVSHRLPLAEANRAIGLLTGRSSTGKVVLEIN